MRPGVGGQLQAAILEGRAGETAEHHGLLGDATHRLGPVDFSSYFGAGLVYKGLISSRDEDICGAGVAHAELTEPVGTGHETAVEIFYKTHLSHWMTLQPDLQYIASPSGIYPDSLVAGFRYQVVF